MPTRYRAVLATTALLLAGQGLLVGVFAFLFYPLSIEGFAPLDEPAASVRTKVVLVVAAGIVLEAATVWTCWSLLRSCMRGISAKRSLRVALAVQAVLLAYTALSGSAAGVVGTGLILAMLAACYRLGLRQHTPGR